MASSSSLLLDMHRAANCDVDKAIAHLTDIYNSILVTRDHGRNDPNSFMESYRAVYRYTVCGVCREPVIVTAAMDTALQSYRQQIEFAAGLGIAEFIHTYMKCWHNFNADMVVVAIVSKYPIQRMDAWKDIMDTTAITERWNSRVLSCPLIQSALQTLFYSIPHLQHLALHKLESLAEADDTIAEELHDNCVVDSVRNSMGGCPHCLAKSGILSIVAPSDNGASFRAMTFST